MKTEHRAIHTEVLRPRIIRTLANHFPSGTPVALVGYPHTWNIGDAALWAAARQLLKDVGFRVRYCCSALNYDPDHLRRHHPEGPILLHGGGNVGDVYAQEQDLRLNVLRDFPERSFLQLPQSVWYRDTASASELRDHMARAENFVFLAREEESLQRARDLLTPHALLCPDLVWGLNPLCVPVFHPCVDVLSVLRLDQESTGNSNALDAAKEVGLSAEQTDWPRPTASDWPWTRSDRLLETMVAPRATAPGGWLQNIIMDRPAWQLSWRKTCWGTVILQRGRVVLADRLHAALLAHLLGKPAILLDNSYHKNRSTYATWQQNLPLLHFASDLREGMALAKKLLAE